MKWKEITIYTTEEGTEIILARLDMLGITQVNIVQGDEEIDALLHSCEKYWDYADEAAMGKQPSVQAYVSDVPENAAVEQAVRNSIAELDSMRSEIGIDMGSLKIEVRSVDEEDWANNWKAYFKPMPVGEKLLVCPSWEKIPEGNTRAVLKIDPGIAFGTGTHHTTRMCLELLEKNIKNGDLVADLRCGSGILSIAASLMGAKETYAIDIDPVAARVAAENAELNGIDMSGYFIRIGDILSDEASMVAGSIGMLSSASLNETKFGLYEPSHGSAPDIAGKNIANPIATVLSAAMMLRYSLDLDQEAEAVENAVQKILKDGYRTVDIMSEGCKKVSTSEMGDLLVKALE